MTEPSARSERPKALRAAIRDLIAGAGLLALGLLLRRSILLGAHEPVDWLFDALAVFWVGSGIVRLIRARALRA